MGLISPRSKAKTDVARRMFPFWMATRPYSVPPVAVVSDWAAAFSSLESAMSFTLQHLEADWELQLVCRSTSAAIMDRLRACGIHGLCFDPDPQSHGEVITFAEIERFLRNEKDDPLDPSVGQRRLA